MPEIAGSLSIFDVASVLRSLCGLGKSGDLVVSRGDWIGQLALDRGWLIGAAAGAELGLPALEFIAAVMTSGDFEFSEGLPTLARNLQLSDPLEALNRLRSSLPQTRLSRLPAPTVVPRVVESDVPDDTDFILGRLALHVLHDIDGVRNVSDIAAHHGLLRTLWALDRLYQLDLITLEPEQTALGYDPGGASPGHTHPVPIAAQDAVAGAGVSGLLERVSAWRSQLSRGRLRSLLVELAQAVLVTGFFIVGIRSMVQNFRVEGTSMLPTFAGGQVLVINRAAYFHIEHSPLAAIVPATHQGSVGYLFGGPQRGDIVVFRAPPQPDSDYIKRVIGLPGESVLIRNGHVFIDGQPLDEPYIDFPARYNFPEDQRAITVPDGNYFVLGDNRPQSLDSHLGWFVPVDNLIGRAWLRYWPPNELGVVQSGQPAEPYGGVPGTSAIVRAGSQLDPLPDQRRSVDGQDEAGQHERAAIHAVR